MISILYDNRLSKYNREIEFAFDYIFQTIGLCHRFIKNPNSLLQYDILILYGQTEPTPSELKSFAHQHITIFIPINPKLYEKEGYTSDQIRRFIRDVKLFSYTPIISEIKFEYPAENYAEQDITACKVNFDLVGNVFYHLAHRPESLEVNSNDKQNLSDAHDIFFKWKDMPYIDNFLWLLDNLIREQARIKKQYLVHKCYWPNGQDIAVALTHTVDRLQKWDWNSIFLSIVDDLGMFVTFRWKQLFRNVWSKLRYIFTNVEMYWNFEEYYSLEQTNQCCSTWFIAAESTPEVDYQLEDPDLQEEINIISRNGSEIALLTTDDRLLRDDFVTRMQIMMRQTQKNQVGIRQHGYKLMGKLKDLHQKILPSYDSSSSYQENSGFKHGMTFPYYYWHNSLKSNHLELPVTFRDYALKISKYSIVQLGDAKQMLKKIFQAVRRSKGLFCSDFTPANYTDIPFCKKLYEYLLALVKAENAWVATCSEIASWWEKRTRVMIEVSEDIIGINFPEAMDVFTLQISGTQSPLSVDYPNAIISGNKIHLKNITPNLKVYIRLSLLNDTIKHSRN